MADFMRLGNIRAQCRGCGGSTSTFEYMGGRTEFGLVRSSKRKPYGQQGEGVEVQYRLFRCAGCGMGGLGKLSTHAFPGNAKYPEHVTALDWFMPEGKESYPLPDSTPEGIEREFREGELCMGSNALRAAAGMFRSVLDKTMRANGYKIKPGTRLDQQIDMAAKDGVITTARRKKAHEEIRVLGNDVLHDEWHEIPEKDVAAARHYCQRILEDFYDDRPAVLSLLRDVGKIPDEDKADETGNEKAEEEIA